MLPTFPTAQKILDAAYFKRILAAKAKVFPHDVHPPVRPIIEGKHSDFQREDRKVKPLEPKLHSVQATFDTKDGKGMTREVFESKARELGEGLGKQMWEMMFEAVEGAVAETGNSLQIKGGEFKQDDFIRMLEMTEHGFDEYRSADERIDSLSRNGRRPQETRSGVGAGQGIQSQSGRGQETQEGGIR